MRGAQKGPLISAADHAFANQKGSSQTNGSSTIVPGSVISLALPKALLIIAIWFS